MFKLDLVELAREHERRWGDDDGDELGRVYDELARQLHAAGAPDAPLEQQLTVLLADHLAVRAASEERPSAEQIERPSADLVERMIDVYADATESDDVPFGPGIGIRAVLRALAAKDARIAELEGDLAAAKRQAHIAEAEAASPRCRCGSPVACVDPLPTCPRRPE